MFTPWKADKGNVENADAIMGDSSGTEAINQANLKNILPNYARKRCRCALTFFIAQHRLMF
jgi:hypothetical protein